MEGKVEEDDRWSSFIDESSKKKGKAENTRKPEITLNDTMLRVMSQKGQVFKELQDIKLKTATEIIQMVTKKAYEISVPWRLYVQRTRMDWAKFLCIRTLSCDHIECIVPLNRPVKPDAFQLQQLPISDLPQHRCLVRTDPSLARSELAILEQQWNVLPEVHDNCIDKNGFFRPDRVLAWFNRDLCEACRCIPIKRLNIKNLEGKSTKDGSIVISTTLRTTPKEEQGDNIITLSISVIPCFVVSKLPTNFKIRAPLPCFSPYLEHQKELRSAIINDLEIGKEIVFLDPRIELAGTDKRIKDCSCPISWQVNTTLLQERILNIVVSMSKLMNFNNIVSLISIIRNERVLDLGALTEDVVIHTACTAFRKNVGKLNSRSEWFLLILKSISEGFKRGFISNYFCPKQNLLVAIDKASISKTYKDLKKLAREVESDPEILYKYTNYDAVKEEKDEDSDDKDENAVKVENMERQIPSISIQPASRESNYLHTYDGTTTLTSYQEKSTDGETKLENEMEEEAEEKSENIKRHLQNDQMLEGKSREQLNKPEAVVHREMTKMPDTTNALLPNEDQEDANRKVNM
ncbi:hypothetical protein CHS0354_011870 [Potamilus streckersoni]|uniref:Uncharacterized protein n=1 Tax=Potamilus streckersoni TaxID=2493646 RepID=A0AAE0T6T1_9BIVA|nr:hypothetical protein CHS0354_011870 [Potamilus streckersoni]